MLGEVMVRNGEVSEFGGLSAVLIFTKLNYNYSSSPDHEN